MRRINFANRAVPAVSILALLAGSVAQASVTPISLDAVMGAAEKANHFLSAAQNEEVVAKKQISIAKGDFLPSLDADAVETHGFTGASALVADPGLTGAGHTGYAVGLMASMTLWDFGRTLNRIREAAHLANAQKAQTELTREDVDSEAARLYFECARYQSQAKAWSFVATQARIVAAQVERFVTTGQRSIVERYLSRAQLEQAFTEQKVYESKVLLAEKQLQVYTRLPLDQISCPGVKQVNVTPLKQTGPGNPLLVRASEQAKAARDRVNYNKDDFLPKLKAFGAVGTLQNEANEANYAVGIGVQLPIFDGFKTVNGVESAEADEQAKENLIAGAQDEIDDTNARFNQIIESAKVRLTHLMNELKIENQGFKVAKDRYFSLQGTLVDLREALRDLMRTRSARINAQAEYLLAITEQKVFNRETKLK